MLLLSSNPRWHALRPCSAQTIGQFFSNHMDKHPSLSWVIWSCIPFSNSQKLWTFHSRCLYVLFWCLPAYQVSDLVGAEVLTIVVLRRCFPIHVLRAIFKLLRVLVVVTVDLTFHPQAFEKHVDLVLILLENTFSCIFKTFLYRFRCLNFRTSRL